MSLGDKMQQYGILIMGLLIGGGFAFGGIASYAGLTDSSSSPGGQDFNATLPSENYMESSFGMSSREQMILAAQSDVVFVNGFYENQEQLETLRELESTSQEFDGRMYVGLSNASSMSPIVTEYGITDYPSVVVIGSARNNQASVLEQPSIREVEAAACDAMRNWGSLAAKCQPR